MQYTYFDSEFNTFNKALNHHKPSETREMINYYTVDRKRPAGPLPSGFLISKNETYIIHACMRGLIILLSASFLPKSKNHAYLNG